MRTIVRMLSEWKDPKSTYSVLQNVPIPVPKTVPNGYQEKYLSQYQEKYQSTLHLF
jgi:hypothetical protein